MTVAGTALGELGQTTAVLVKSIQNILIGFIAFAVAIFFSTRVEKREGEKKVTAAEIWYRLPKFILGFFAASLVASFVVLPLTLYIVGQLFNIVLTFAVVWLLLSGRFFPLPNLAL